LQEQATLRTRVHKDGVIDWDAATRGWQAKAAQQAGVDLASLYRRVTRLRRDGCMPRDAGLKLMRDDIMRTVQRRRWRSARVRTPSGPADLIANLGRVLPQRAADPTARRGCWRRWPTGHSGFATGAGVAWLPTCT
jgi:hypothetical protein